MKNGLLIALLALTGCATLERHPIATAVAGGILIGSIAASGHRAPDRHISTPTVDCQRTSCL